jgi:hypothetical protein
VLFVRVLSWSIMQFLSDINARLNRANNKSLELLAAVNLDHETFQNNRFGVFDGGVEFVNCLWKHAVVTLDKVTCEHP